jgi:hypothetical protein
MASMIYDSFSEHLGDNTIDMDNHEFKVVLLTAAHTPNSAHTTYADIAGDELPDGNGYTVGGKTLANVTWTRDGAKSTFDADDPIWTGATFDAAYAAVYDATSTDNVLACLIDFGGTKSVATGTFTIQINPEGLLTVGG